MTSVRCSRSILLCNFYSHAPYGTWPNVPSSLTDFTRFLLTRPLRDVTSTIVVKHWKLQFLLTRPLRDVTRDDVWYTLRTKISTHTPLTGRDVMMAHLLNISVISTHTPLTGRDIFIQSISPLHKISTHTPLTGRDRVPETVRRPYRHFYSHAPYGTWLPMPLSVSHSSLISTHTPLTGRD